MSPAPTGCESAKSRSGSASPQGCRGQPLDHGAALAAVEVDGVAELAHARVDGDEAEEHPHRQEYDPEVHPASGVVRVPDGVGAVPLRPAPDGLVELVVLVRLMVVRTGVDGVVGADRLSHRGQQRASAVAAAGAVGGGDDGGGLGLVQARDDLGGARAGVELVAVRAVPAVETDRGGVPYGLEESGGAGVAGGGLAAPHDGRAPAASGPAAAHGGDPGGPRGGGAAHPCALAGGELHPEAGVVDDDLRWVAVHLGHAQGG